MMALSASCGSDTTIGNHIPFLRPTLASNALTRVSAPTRTSVMIQVGRQAPPGADALSNYVIQSVWGDLEVLDAERVGDALLLTTAPQKLGVEYHLELDIDGLYVGEHFLAADTATFWASDLTTPEIDQLHITAERVAVGEHAVVYVEEGLEFASAEDLIDFFDSRVYPTETTLFNPAPDRDGNGRIVLLGLAGGNAFGGYFSSINAYPDEQSVAEWGRHSNEMEMLYLNADTADMNGEEIVAHEFSHLLYHESHDPSAEWGYQNEGMAECAVHAVTGSHKRALVHYQADPTYTIRDGLSLVDWTFGNYPQYAQAYVFWSYIASQLGGIDGYGTLFALDGNPDVVDAFLQAELGMNMSETQLHSLIASWVQAPSGPHGFGGMLHFEQTPNVATTSSLQLLPFSAVFLAPAEATLDYSGMQGQDIRFVGINAAGVVDFTAPFDVDGGVLVVQNTAQDFETPDAQSTGLSPLPEQEGGADDALRVDPNAWLHPPPVDPRHFDHLRAWQKRAGVLR
jgi:hypothetical protein